mgnify:CR=1 FL=1|jgi:hypothetical protein
MNIWRIHLKTASQVGVDQRQLCLDKGIVGVGWQIDYETVPVTWEEYRRIAEVDYGDISWKTALNAIKNRIQVDDLIWTRDWVGNYFLGRILSDWYYDIADECAQADVVNIRKCEWHKIGTEEAVPGKVVSSLRAPRTVQVINDDTTCYFSKILYNQKVGKIFYEVNNLTEKDIFSLLSADDCEDALAIYLQATHDYLIIPSSCKDDTMAYEFELKHRKTGKNAVVQVKSGLTSLNINEYDKLDTDIFLFATSGQYYGTPNRNITTIEPDVVRTFLYEQTHLLPDKLKIWVELTR